MYGRPSLEWSSLICWELLPRGPQTEPGFCHGVCLRWGGPISPCRPGVRWSSLPIRDVCSMRLRSLPRQKGSELTRRGAEHSHGADSPPAYVRLAGLKNLSDAGVGLRRPLPLHPVSSPVGQAPWPPRRSPLPYSTCQKVITEQHRL